MYRVFTLIMNETNSESSQKLQMIYVICQNKFNSVLLKNCFGMQFDPYNTFRILVQCSTFLDTRSLNEADI